ncbi:MAG: GspE/PulE family protein [Verrucomicrobiota bacterium]
MQNKRTDKKPESGINDKSPDTMPAQAAGLLDKAIKEKATDIHIDPVGPNAYRICHRVDGVIHAISELPFSEGKHLINQIKVASQLTPDHTFVPIESRMVYSQYSSQKEIRVTIMPTTRGEATHMRILAPPEEIIEPSELGISKPILNQIKNVLRRPEGLILISGPTGAGKTMTLYSLVSLLNLESSITVSIEDPVEYDLSYVRQVQADPEHGLSMHEGLKSVLRMDPDIVVIGEIRDPESARTSVRAAASGRFVLATLHARDVALATEACMNYSIPRHLLASTLRMVAAQNLVRRVCCQCMQRRKITEEEKKMFKNFGIKPPDQVPEAAGCDKCHKYGYDGRVGIYEVVSIDKSLRSAISEGVGAGGIAELIRNEGVKPLQADALLKVAEGVTTMEEIQQIHFPAGA